MHTPGGAKKDESHVKNKQIQDILNIERCKTFVRKITRYLKHENASHLKYRKMQDIQSINIRKDVRYLKHRKRQDISISNISKEDAKHFKT